MSEARARIADRMVGELLEYLIGEVLPGADLSDPAWEAMAALGREVIEAIGRFERGELSYETLEAAGTRYVEAWVGASARNCLNSQHVTVYTFPRSKE